MWWYRPVHQTIGTTCCVPTLQLQQPIVYEELGNHPCGGSSSRFSYSQSSYSQSSYFSGMSGAKKAPHCSIVHEELVSTTIPFTKQVGLTWMPDCRPSLMHIFKVLAMALPLLCPLLSSRSNASNAARDLESNPLTFWGPAVGTRHVYCRHTHTQHVSFFENIFILVAHSLSFRSLVSFTAARSLPPSARLSLCLHLSLSLALHPLRAKASARQRRVNYIDTWGTISNNNSIITSTKESCRNDKHALHARIRLTALTASSTSLAYVCSRLSLYVLSSKNSDCLAKSASEKVQNASSPPNCLTARAASCKRVD